MTAKHPRHHGTTRGFAQAASLLVPRIRAVGEARGFAVTRLLTHWAEIVGLYDVLMRAAPSPIVALNRAVAVAMRDGPDAGLALIDAILDAGDLRDYRLAHAARADLCRRLGRNGEAIKAYERALAYTGQAPERRYFEKRIVELKK